MTTNSLFTVYTLFEIYYLKLVPPDDTVYNSLQLVEDGHTYVSIFEKLSDYLTNHFLCCSVNE